MLSLTTDLLAPPVSRAGRESRVYSFDSRWSMEIYWCLSISGSTDEKRNPFFQRERERESCRLVRIEFQIGWQQKLVRE